MEDTIFDKIAKKEIPVPIVYEDDKVFFITLYFHYTKCIAIYDKFPAAPIHILLFPKNKDGLSSLSKVKIIFLKTIFFSSRQKKDTKIFSDT